MGRAESLLTKADNLHNTYIELSSKILFLMSKCIVCEAQMTYLRIPSLPLMKDMKDGIVTFA